MGFFDRIVRHKKAHTNTVKKPSIQPGRASVPRNEKPVPRNEKPVPRNEKPVPRNEKPVPRNEKPVPRNEKPVPGKEEPVSRNPQGIVNIIEEHAGLCISAMNARRNFMTQNIIETKVEKAVVEPAGAEEAAETVEAVETAEAAEATEAVEAKAAEAADTAETAEAAKTIVETEETAEREAAPPEKFPTHRKAYLIDSENVSDEWVDLLDTMDRQDAIFVFYTGKSTHINCEHACKLMQRGIDRVHWIKCFEGNNALDFQLVTELGAMIGWGKAAEYIIISKDNGYNPVVRYWNDRGIAVSKKGTKTDKKTEEPVEMISVSAAEKASPDKASLESPDKTPPESPDKTPPESPEKTPLGKAEKPHLEAAEIPSPVKVLLTGSVKAALGGEFLSEVLKSVDIMDNTMLYPVLTAFEGQAAGAEDYRQLRDLSREKKTVLRGLLLQDKRDRGMNYVRLIVRRNHWAVDVEELYEIILRSSRKYKDQYRKALVEKFGKESGEIYYNATKSHYNYVKKV